MVQKKKYGVKEVAEVVFYDTATGKPSIFFDSLKTSSIENASESAQATGGQGGGSLIEWDYGRTATLTLSDALLSDKSLSMLAGSSVQTENINLHKREVLTVVDGKVTLSHAPNDINKVSVFKTEGGAMLEEITTVVGGVDSKELTITGATGDVEVYYQHVAPAGATSVTFSSDKFPSTYKVVGDTLVRNTDGLDEAMQFVIYKAKLQSGFTFTMDVENVSTFDFTLNAMVDPTTKKIYDIIRY